MPTLLNMNAVNWRQCSLVRSANGGFGNWLCRLRNDRWRSIAINFFAVKCTLDDISMYVLCICVVFFARSYSWLSLCTLNWKLIFDFNTTFQFLSILNVNQIDDNWNEMSFSWWFRHKNQMNESRAPHFYFLRIGNLFLAWITILPEINHSR